MATYRILSRFFFTLILVLAGCTFEDMATTTTPEAPAATLPGDELARVVDIIDGDTIDVEINGQEYRVRYTGVNTPERDEACYRDATEANATLVEDQTVLLVKDVSDTDRYGRLLRYVYVGDVFVNAELVADGYAEAGYYPPDTAYLDYFEELEASAKAANRGCHPTGVFD
jgi:micrococcal nuclease